MLHSMVDQLQWALAFDQLGTLIDIIGQQVETETKQDQW